jgi:hypothetical protein
MAMLSCWVFFELLSSKRLPGPRLPARPGFWFSAIGSCRRVACRAHRFAQARLNPSIERRRLIQRPAAELPELRATAHAPQFAQSRPRGLDAPIGEIFLGKIIGKKIQGGNSFRLSATVFCRHSKVSPFAAIYDVKRNGSGIFYIVGSLKGFKADVKTARNYFS